VLQDLKHFEEAENACESIDAELIQFESDKQVQQFVALIKAGDPPKTVHQFVLPINNIGDQTLTLYLVDSAFSPLLS
jgi:hypothetical protein